MVVTLLDYGAGNVRSVRNALRELGYTVQNVKTAEDILSAEKLIFPGVGSFGLVMHRLQESGYIEPLQRRIKENKPFLGICVALQALFEGSEESPGVPGLGIIAGQVVRFPETKLSRRLAGTALGCRRNPGFFTDMRMRSSTSFIPFMPRLPMQPGTGR